jgi:hypothetical protein
MSLIDAVYNEERLHTWGPSEEHTEWRQGLWQLLASIHTNILEAVMDRSLPRKVLGLKDPKLVPYFEAQLGILEHDQDPWYLNSAAAEAPAYTFDSSPTARETLPLRSNTPQPSKLFFDTQLVTSKKLSRSTTYARSKHHGGLQLGLSFGLAQREYPHRS